MVPVYAEELDPCAARLDGRTLVRSIPEGVDGLLFHLPDRPPVEVDDAFFPTLRGLAEAWDLEAALTVPSEGQVEALKQTRWWVRMSGGKIHLDTSTGQGHVASAFTHPNRAGYAEKELVAVTGEKLFRWVVETDAADGVVVNRGSEFGSGENRLHAMLLSPGIASRLLEGCDLRPGAGPLPARTRAEVELWLNLHGFPWKDRVWVDAPYPDHTLLRVRSPDPDGSRWRMQEPWGEQSSHGGQCWSPVFTLPPGGLTEPGFGTGVSPILCAGLLARELNVQALDSREPERYWKVGRFLLFGRLLDDQDRDFSRRRAALATELAKLIPPGAERIPRSAILTVEGAKVLREHPHGATRAWIEATLRQAERYTKRWVS
jgi:hypothetical protein